MVSVQSQGAVITRASKFALLIWNSRACVLSRRDAWLPSQSPRPFSQGCFLPRAVFFQGCFRLTQHHVPNTQRIDARLPTTTSAVTAREKITRIAICEMVKSSKGWCSLKCGPPAQSDPYGTNRAASPRFLCRRFAIFASRDASEDIARELERHTGRSYDYDSLQDLNRGLSPARQDRRLHRKATILQDLAENGCQIVVPVGRA